jgi:hypothetical protein
MQKQFEHEKKENSNTIPFYYSNWFILGLIICLLSMGYLWDNYISPKTIVTTTKVISVPKPSAQNSSGIKFAKIQDVQVGERAIGRNPEVTDSDRVTVFFPDPEPATWQKLTLEMFKPDGKRLDITLLRPLSWITESQADIGTTIFLDLPEMGAQGQAKVLNIEPCPPIKKGKGNVITGTFHHEAANTVDLYVEGLSKPIGCTDNHPFWSVTRNEFIEAGKLQQGEALQLHSGQIAKVVQILPRPGPERVHNLEVLNEHVYYVADIGILVHNNCTNKHHAIPKFLGGDTNQKLAEISYDSHIEYHRLLRVALDKKGLRQEVGGNASKEQWMAYFQNKPGKQVEAFEAVIEAAHDLKKTHPTDAEKILTSFLDNLENVRFDDTYF